MRTKKSVLNLLSDILPFFIIGILNFFRVKFILNYYGTETNGYIQLISQIFSYLALAEAGFGTAVVYKLYKPLAENNKEKISEIVNGSKLIFKKIAIVMTIGSILCTVAIPLFVNRGSLTISFLVVVFLLYSINYIIEYFTVYPYTSLLQADQNQYIFTFYRNTVKIIFGIAELFLMSYKVNIILIIFINIIFTISYVLVLLKKIKKIYPWLNKTAVKDTSAFGMTKDVIVHKLSTLLSSKTDSILLSNFSLAYVTLYTSYNYILDFIATIISKIFNALKASYCNIVALEKQETKKYFEFFVTFSFFAACFCATVFDTTVNRFIKIIWLGQDYSLQQSVVHLFTIIMFGRIIINPIYIARDSKGLYKETKMFTVMQAVSNLVISLLLVKKYNILGVLIGTILSQYLILIPMNIKIVYKRIFKGEFKTYLTKTIFSIIVVVITLLADNLCLKFLSLETKIAVMGFMVLIAILNFAIITLLYVIFDKDFRLIIKEIKQKIRRKK